MNHTPRTVALVLLLAACGASQTTTSRPQGHASGTAAPPAASETVTSEEVTADAAGRAVHGTLTHPGSAGRHPAVLLIAGSGPTDRDWNSPRLPGTNGSGRLLAEALTRGGYTVLRYDKLGTGQTPVPTHPVAWSDYHAEQTAMLAVLRAHASVDPTRIFVAGHSEGGMHAVHLVNALPEAERPRGLVLLSSASRSMRDTVLGQIETQYRDGAGVTGAALEGTMRPIAAAFDDISAGRAPDIAHASSVPAVRELIAAFANPAGGPIARELLAYDTAVVLSHLRIPVLVLNGGRDMQVSADQDGRRLERLAREGGNTDVTFHLAPFSNHVYKYEEHAPTPQEQAAHVQAYNAADRRLDPDVPEAILAWLRAH